MTHKDETERKEYCEKGMFRWNSISLYGTNFDGGVDSESQLMKLLRTVFDGRNLMDSGFGVFSV
jgi:hypothetical protein